MGSDWRILFLLLHKNFIVRKRHWLGTIAEVSVPACIFAVIMAIRTLLASEPSRVETPTFYEMQSRADLIENIPRSLLHVYYLPQNDFTQQLMESTNECLNLPQAQLIGFDTEDALLQQYELQQSEDILISILAIYFKNTNNQTMPQNLVYTIKTSVPTSSSLLAFEYGGPSILSDRLVDAIPFVTLQMCLDDAYISKAAPESSYESNRFIQKMPYPPYDNVDMSVVIIQDISSIWGGMLFIVTLFMIPSYITAEKSTGVNALLKMNGMKSYQNFLSWMISGNILSVITIILLTIVVKVEFDSDQLPFFYYSNGFIFAITIFIHLIHIHAFCMHVASYFSKAYLAQGASIFVTYVIMQVVSQLNTVGKFTSIPYLGIVFPNAAAIRLFDEFNKHENQFIGVQWNNIFTTAHPTLNWTGSIGVIMIFSILGSIMHFVIALYLDTVLPTKYGVHKSPFFFLQSQKHNKVDKSDAGIDKNPENQPKLLEPVADGAFTPGIHIRGLRKSYTMGFFQKMTVDAVRGVNIDFYKGQITALLGHNGAGKTTTISIITGLTSPTAGTVHINGKNIQTDLNEIRNDLGMCPQENMMFPDLTVLEQLRLFGMLKLKNKTKEQLWKDVDELLVKLKIDSKKNVLPAKMSGGQKRRLCLGMALIGDASTLILDEPTSGMDPETSRITWDIILKYREKKTIIITTHSMEEADVLGDRVAIMHSGEMRCYGTAMFLKKFYGHNYHEITLSTEQWCDPEKIRQLVGTESRINTNYYGRIIVSIPFTNSLPEILDRIEQQKTDLGITGVSVSMITLEEVFLKAAEEEDVVENGVHHTGEKIDSTVRQSDKLSGSDLTRAMIWALLSKKFAYVKQNRGMFLGIVFTTLIAVILMPILNMDYTIAANHRLLSLSVYSDTETLIYSENNTLGETYRQIISNQNGQTTDVGSETSLSSALIDRGVKDIVYYLNRIVISAEFNQTVQNLTTNGLYSGSSSLSAPIVVNTLSNLFLKTLAGNDYSIVASIENLPQSLTDLYSNEVLIQTQNVYQIMLFISIFFFVTGFYVMHPLMENATLIKQLQLMTGIPSWAYWGTTFAFDYFIYMLSSVVILAGFFFMDIILNLNTYYTREMGIILLLLMLFGINILLLAYIHSFMRKPLYIVLLLFSLLPIILAQIQTVLYMVYLYMSDDAPELLIQRRIFSLFPQVSFTFGFNKFMDIASATARCRELPNRLNDIACLIQNTCCGLGCTDGVCANPLPYFRNFGDDPGIEEFVIYLALSPIGLVAFLYILEEKLIRKLLNKLTPARKKPVLDDTMDSEVLNEKNLIRQEINNRQSNPNYEDESVFLAYELSKHYGKVQAVREVNFRVMKNECFGLLGVNGAGKSTTFRMLVGEEDSTGGILLLGRHNIKSNRAKYLSQIGYCPQTHALVPCFNAYEHLTLMARLRGVPSSEVAEEVAWWINKLQLNKHARNPSRTYSGGNKRRLSIAMALIASPNMVLLDEPTTGVDPAARRSLWSVLQSCQASGQAIILTSHSMEECEALCNRLVIMVQGRLVCSGASQQLKDRFGAGYDITIKLNPGRPEEELREIKEKIQEHLVCQLQDEHSGYLSYHVTDPTTTWSTMFDTMNDIKSDYDSIEDFTVSSATLERLFIRFARAAPDSDANSLDNSNQAPNELNGVGDSV